MARDHLRIPPSAAMRRRVPWRPKTKVWSCIRETRTASRRGGRPSHIECAQPPALRVCKNCLVKIWSISASGALFSFAFILFQRLHLIADVLSHLPELLHMLANPNPRCLIPLDEELLEVLFETVDQGFELIVPFHSEMLRFCE